MRQARPIVDNWKSEGSPKVTSFLLGRVPSHPRD
jgi:hypothetical protein